MVDSEEERKNPLMKVKEESEKADFKHSKNEDHGIRSHHFMANRWGNNGNSKRLILGAPKSLQMVTAAMKLRRLLLGRKAMTNLDSILKSRDITLLAKISIVKLFFFSSHVDVRVGPL